MDAVAGPDGYDLRVPETYVPDMASQLEHGVEGLRIGVLDEGMQAVVEPDVADAVQAAVSTLTAAGATARRVSVPIHHAAMRIAAPLLYEALSLGYFTAFAGQPGVGYVSPTFASAMGKFRAAAASRLPLRVKSFILTGRYLHERYDGAIGARVAALRKPMTDAYDAILSEVDVLAMPTVPMKAPLFQPGATYAEANVLAGTGGGAEFAVVAANTWPFNLTGHPAISVPCATSAGLPIALQLVASRFDDKTLLRAANAFQHAVPWEALITPPAATQQAGS
jgi:amidase